jgi:hypothetical protein
LSTIKNAPIDATAPLFTSAAVSEAPDSHAARNP